MIKLFVLKSNKFFISSEKYNLISFKLIFLSIIILPFHYLFAQQSNITFEHFSIDQGMHESIVPYIFQDRRGFLWFTTWVGLERFDGYNFLNYQHDPQNPASIDDAFLTTIYEDKSGILWVGTWRGLERFDPVTEAFTHYTPHPPGTNTEWSNHITSILEDRTGVLWIGTGEGLNIFDRKTFKFTSIKNDSTNPNSLICNAITVIFEDKEGELWFGTGNGLDKFDRKTKHFTHYFSNPYNKNDLGNWGNSAALLMPMSSTSYSSWITSVFEDEKGIFWIGTWGGLIKFNHKLNTSTFFNHNPNSPTSLGCNKILTICQDVSGTLWLSTQDHGVDSFNKLTNVFKHFTHYDNDPSSLSNDNTLTVKSERSGTIWITSVDGVNKLNRTRQPFELLMKENIQSIINGQKGSIFIRTKKEVKKLDPGTEEFTHHSFVKDYLITVDNDGSLWMCKAEEGMYKQDALGKITRFYYSTGKEFDHNFSCIYKSSDGIIWIGSDSGLFFIDPVTQHVTRKDNNKFNINIIHEDKYGMFWVGTEMGGLFCYNRNQDTVTQYISNLGNHSAVGFSSILDIHEDKNGTLWIAANNGLNKYNRATKSFTNFPGNGAFSILEDDHGKLWLNNRQGISKFDPETNTFKNYDVSYGLPANGFNDILGLKATDGEMYFGGPNGLIRFHPDSVKDNPYIPPIVITAFKKFNVDAKLDSSISEKKIIYLPYFENSISFEFVSLNYSSTQKNQYAYKLEGLERNWVYSGTRRFASYPNLDPGKYVFRVKGSNNDGVWNEAGTSIAIIISPPWWKTWWFRIPSLLILLVSIGGTIRYVEMKKIKRKIEMLEQERALERERTRISRDMHDEVGSSLSEIAILSELAKKKPEEAEQRVQEISERAAEIIDSVGEIVWAMNPQNDKLDNLIAHTRRFAVKYLSLANFSCQFIEPEIIPAYTLSAGLRRNIFLVVKEALHNIVKHSGASEVLINIEFCNDQLNIQIKDNGKGFLINEVSGLGNGLINMQKRIEDIGGKIKIETAQGDGTQISFSIKLFK